MKTRKVIKRDRGRRRTNPGAGGPIPPFPSGFFAGYIAGLVTGFFAREGMERDRKKKRGKVIPFPRRDGPHTA